MDWFTFNFGFNFILLRNLTSRVGWMRINSSYFQSKKKNNYKLLKEFAYKKCPIRLKVYKKKLYKNYKIINFSNNILNEKRI